MFRAEFLIQNRECYIIELRIWYGSDRNVGLSAVVCVCVCVCVWNFCFQWKRIIYLKLALF
jgi:hypothetical protein